MDHDALEIFQDCHQRGGKGLKLYNGHSYYYEIFNITLDSPRMKPIYAYAERNHLPVLFHVNISKYYYELDNVLTQFPDLTVSVPHFMVSSINLNKVMELMDKHPNLYTDTSFGSEPFLAAGFRRISSNTDKYIDFIKQYPDRVLFGTDMVLTETERKDQTFMENTLQCYKDILTERTFECPRVSDYYQKILEENRAAYEKCKPKSGYFCQSKAAKVNTYTKWHKEAKKLNGLHLSSKILRQIFNENPERFLRANQD